MCGPGAGILWGRAELLEKMPPFLTGGEMIRTVELEKTTWNDLPWKFEAGTPAIAESIALGAAAQYLQGIGMEAIEAHEHALTAYAYDVLDGISAVTQYGPKPPNRAGILSFNVGNVHPHDVAQVLDSEGIAVRAGHHCTQPLMKRFGVPATTRASFYLYTVPEEIDRLCDGLEDVRELFA
jgi:cysteine desulfurase/selenocysteine lyase